MKYIKSSIIITCIQLFFANGMKAQCTYDITFGDNGVYTSVHLSDTTYTELLQVENRWHLLTAKR